VEHLHHFGLTQDPFSNELDLRFYFESASHRDAQRRVERGLRQHKGLTLLTGEGGMGKTLLTRRILEALEEEVFEATLLVMLPGAADATSVLQRFARQLGCGSPAADRSALIAQLYEHLAIVREDGRHAVLLVDDAQILSPGDFAELTGLLNLEYEDRRLVSMLFVGSAELDRLIQSDPGIQPRIDVRVQLQPLDMENSAAYLRHRLVAVNGDPAIVPPPAMETLFKLGRGRPRLLSTLADNALFEAYLAGRGSIEPGDVERAAADLGIGPDPGSTWSRASAMSMSAIGSTPLPGDPIEPVAGSSGLFPTEAVPVDGADFPAVGTPAGPAARTADARAFDPLAPPTGTLELDEPVEGLEFPLSLDEEAGSPGLDLDDGFEVALESAAAAVEEEEADADLMAAVPELSFADDGLDTMGELGLDDATGDPELAPSFDEAGRPPGGETLELTLEAEVDSDALDFAEEPPLALQGESFGKAAPLLGGEPLLDGEPLLEAVPLEFGEGEELDDAFVELIEE
jgi:type II secretory pathway predicted ATPase ExeA